MAKTFKPPKPSGGTNVGKIFNSKKEVDRYRNEFDAAKRILQHVDTVPTYNPKTFFEQFVLYENGSTYRLYVYLNGTWRYVSLT